MRLRPQDHPVTTLCAAWAIAVFVWGSIFGFAVYMALKLTGVLS